MRIDVDTSQEPKLDDVVRAVRGVLGELLTWHASASTIRATAAIVPPSLVVTGSTTFATG